MCKCSVEIIGNEYYCPMCRNKLKMLTDGQLHCNKCGNVYMESDFQFVALPDSSDGAVVIVESEKE